MGQITKLLVLLNFILIFGMIPSSKAEQGGNSVAGVLVFSTNVSIEKAAEMPVPFYLVT
jgi:hypothetical protein